MNFNPGQFAINMLNRNPQIANNPRAQELLQVIQNGDSAKGEQIANNLCTTMGVSKEQAIRDAKQFFHIS